MFYMFIYDRRLQIQSLYGQSQTEYLSNISHKNAKHFGQFH